MGGRGEGGGEGAFWNFHRHRGLKCGSLPWMCMNIFWNPPVTIMSHSFHHNWPLTRYWILAQSESYQLFLIASLQKYQAFWLQHMLAGSEVT